MKTLKIKALSSLVWAFTEQFSLQIIMFVVSIVMARMLMPDEFGLIAMPTVFIAIGIALRDSGLSSSLIRTKSPTDSDYSTVFYMNMGLSIIIYASIYSIAPYVADFYEKAILSDIIRVQATTIVIGAVTSIQHTRLTKNMEFKRQMSIQLPSIVISAALGIGFAYLGYGVWSLVYMNVIQYVIAAFHYWFSSSWRPSMVFSIEKVKEHFLFGSRLTLSGILDVIYENLYTIIIGKTFGASQLGYYTRAKSTQELPIRNISTALNKVTYSLFAEIQDDDFKLKDVYSRIMQQVLFWIVPTLIVAIVVAEPLFEFVFSEKWLPAVPYFQLLCFVGILSPLNMYNLNILKVKGRSDLYLISEVINKTYTIVLAILLMQYGIHALLYLQIAVTITSFLVSSYICGKLINFGPVEQVRTVCPILINGAIMGVVSFLFYTFIKGLDVHALILIAFTCVIGLSVYFVSAVVFNAKPLNELKQLVKKKSKVVA